MSSQDTTFPLAEVDALLASICRRKRLSPEEAEDFSSWARLRLYEKRSSLFDGFEGRSSERTYLIAVLVNLLRDYRTARWGKFRPSAAAERLGTVAIRLEMLVFRDGLGFDEAARILRDNEGVGASLEELEAMYVQLPARAGRHLLGEEDLPELVAPERADGRLLHQVAETAAGRVEAALDQALRTLDRKDRLLLKLRLQDGFTVAAIARSLRRDQKSLYRRLDRLAAKLRRELAARGVGAAEVGQVLAWEAVELRVDYHLEGENGGTGPSPQEGRA